MWSPSTQPREVRTAAWERLVQGRSGLGRLLRTGWLEKPCRDACVHVPLVLCISKFPASAFCSFSDSPPRQGSCPEQQVPVSLFLLVRDGFPPQFASGSICALDLTQAGFAEVSLSAVILPAEAPPPKKKNTYPFSVFFLRNGGTFSLGPVRSVETLRSLLTVTWASSTLLFTHHS